VLPGGAEGSISASSRRRDRRKRAWSKRGMRLEEGLHLAMSGGGGFDLTDAFDCNAFLFDAGNGEWVLFDAGAGRDPAGMEAVLAADGIEPGAMPHLFLTHAHADHSGGARGLRDRLGLLVHAGPRT